MPRSGSHASICPRTRHRSWLITHPSCARTPGSAADPSRLGLGGLVGLHLAAQGHRQAVAIGAHGALGFVQLAEQPAQLLVSLRARTQYDAGFEVAFRLAPELGHYAQAPGGEQERRALA